MNIKLKALLFLILAATSQIFAHALWIETPATGKVGQKQEVKIYYGEYAENERNSVQKWYSDVKELSLWLVGPDQQKTKLEYTKGVDALQASFTPSKDGVYTLTISHDAKDFGGTTKYQFNAIALVAVGKVAAGSTPVAKNNEILVFHDAAKTYKINTPIQLKTLFKEAAQEKLHVTVASPSGWVKTVNTNAQGVAEFTPLWAGKYFIEVSKYGKEEGELNCAKHESVWRCATVLFEVK